LHCYCRIPKASSKLYKPAACQQQAAAAAAAAAVAAAAVAACYPAVIGKLSPSSTCHTYLMTSQSGNTEVICSFLLLPFSAPAASS
jgi:hypothetical protein